jgi:O-antigen ligase
MSKFNNPSRALAPPRPPLVAPRPQFRPPPPPPFSKLPLDVPSDLGAAPAGESPLVAIGFVAFCTLLVSGMINDWALLMFGGKGYISTVMVVITPALWLASGNALRAFRDKTGIAWLLLLGCMFMSVPFSVWRSNSLLLILGYVSRSLCFYFYVACFTTSLKRCRTLMLVNVAVAVMVLISCFKFGYSDLSGDARFQIRGSMFVGNSNDLALNLAIAMTEFLFLFYIQGIGKRLLGFVGILLSLFYMLKTGSRGCVLALGIALIFTFVLSRQKAKLMLAAIPVFVIAIFLTPSSSAHRVLLMFEGRSGVSNMSDASAIESQAQRQELIRKSLSLTLTHPLFGVGMGEFVVAVMGEAAKKGQWAAALGTHNSYTQVSSECGIPALICYVSVIGICFQRSYRIYKLAAAKSQFREIEGLAFSLLIGTLVYAVATFFFHIAYSGLLPMLSGEIMALYTIVYPVLAGKTNPSTANATQFSRIAGFRPETATV